MMYVIDDIPSVYEGSRKWMRLQIDSRRRLVKVARYLQTNMGDPYFDQDAAEDVLSDIAGDNASAEFQDLLEYRIIQIAR